MVPSGVASGRERPTQVLAAQAQRLGAGLDAEGVLGRRRPVVAVLAAYAAVGAAAACVSVALGESPASCEGWLGMTGAASVLSSLGLGVCIGAITVGATRVVVRRAAWARALHGALRPAVHRAGDLTLLAVALASGVGEELLFRGLLVPLLGILGSSVVFGALHQIPGRARWWWVAWATAMGLVFALVYVATGSLAGPIVAHAAINAVNLRYLRDTDLAPRPRALGGLLRRT